MTLFRGDSLAAFALNMKAPNACDRCLNPLDPEADLHGQHLVVQPGTWCATCETSEAFVPAGYHDVRLEKSPEGFAACVRCKRLLDAEQVFERCASAPEQGVA